MKGWFHEKSLAIWSSVSTGIFLIGYNIGTGSITAMASAGAEYGMSLTWALLLSCLFTYSLMIAFSRYTMVTGQTVLHGFRTHFGAPVTLFILVSLLSAEVMSSMGLMGVAAEVIGEWSRPLTADGEGFNQLGVALFFAVLLGFVCWQGKQSVFEKVLSLFVFIMGLSFLATLFVVTPSPEVILRGLKPSIPDHGNALMVVSSMVGTTMGAILFVVRSILVADKGWTMADMRMQKRDAAVSVIMMFVLSFAIMACAAGAMPGEKIENAIQMVKLIEPLAGRIASAVFVGGIVAAALSSLFPILLLAPWLIADYQGKKCDMTSTQTRLLILAGLLCSLAVPLFGGRPVRVMIASQTLAVIATPLVVLFMTILLNRRRIMHENRPKIWQNGIYVLVFLFSAMMAVFGIAAIGQNI
ncbi:Nramp family divalent metal transporter [Alistipes sp.]|uniref:Nramp family divalent metal transporter n=1 Tax=Alistipes sp. TaxID=1872444 RepID=UPI003A8422B4